MPSPTDRQLVTGAAVLFAATFALDLYLPVEVAGGVPHLTPVLLTLWHRHRHSTWAAAAIATVLTVAGYLLPHQGGDLLVVEINRFLALMAIWVTAVGVQIQKRTRWRLDREQAQKERILAVAPALFVALDPDGRVTFMNPWGCALLGCTEDEVRGADWFERFVPPRARASERAALSKQLGEGVDALVLTERPLQTPSGEERWMAWHDAVLRDLAGQVVGRLSSGVDVTERRQVERKLADQRALAKLGEMAALVAHEVKNPLSGIAGAIQVIQDRFPPDSRERKVLVGAHDRITALDQSVSDLLEFARPRALDSRALDLREILDQAAELIEDNPAFREIELRVSGIPTGPVRGDPHQLRAAFLNLMLNAAQAMEGVGRLVVELEEGEADTTVSVRDNGPGIAPQDLPLVFEPFFTTKTRGTGLGLCVVRRTVEAHHGTIEIESPPGQGTTVRVTLPRTG